ncbi:MAG: ferrochelatase [Steroidobacteraceae bacterium]|nr:ferrochelatase [Steroidobacteraceae bacterium]MDW8258333.1 ferrochelatase [Gammaproteobacteria bacterium]
MHTADPRAWSHDAPERIGVLLVNSGTPDSPEIRDVRHFLRRLLGDPRVVELPRWIWLPVLHGIVLTTRPWRSARKYRRIWTDRGSPLMVASMQLRARLAVALGRRVLAPLSIELAMLYARPSVAQGLAALRDAGAQRVLVIPLFPQYCAVTSGAVFDQVTAELQRWRWLPELRFVREYHDDPAYIRALAESVRVHWAREGRSEHLLLSFHGIPQRYVREGDPYYCKCQKTARLLAEELNLRDADWSLSFHARFGPGRWLQPYTDTALRTLARQGCGNVAVLCPGFAVDCLETLEDIAITNRDIFFAAGGLRFSYIPALNAAPAHAELLAHLAVRHTGGWTAEELTAFAGNAGASQSVRPVPEA